MFDSENRRFIIFTNESEASLSFFDGCYYKNSMIGSYIHRTHMDFGKNILKVNFDL